MDRDHVDVGREFLEATPNRIGPVTAPFGERDAHEGQARAELLHEGLTVFWRDNHHHLLHVGPIGELLRGMEPDRPTCEWGERLFVVSVLETAALTGRGEDHSEVGHYLIA